MDLGWHLLTFKGSEWDGIVQIWVIPPKKIDLYYKGWILFLVLWQELMVSQCVSVCLVQSGQEQSIFIIHIISSSCLKAVLKHAWGALLKIRSIQLEPLNLISCCTVLMLGLHSVWWRWWIWNGFKRFNRDLRPEFGPLGDNKSKTTNSTLRSEGDKHRQQCSYIWYDL